MPVRTPAVAGQFYPAAPEVCRREVRQLTGQQGPVPSLEGLTRLLGGIVPHAGWICSGAVAGEVLRLLASGEPPQTFVLFGAMHRARGQVACVFTDGAWSTPLGEIAVDEELASALPDSPLLALDDESHELEHSIEVQVPFIQELAPAARLLPILVPPSPKAPHIGELVADAAARLGRRAVYVGSTDLTHYGPRYGFTPHGAGADAIRWAHDVNDRQLIDRLLALDAEGVVPEAMLHHNACGSGAAAAALAAARRAGANAARLLRSTSSYEVLRGRFGDMDDSVGYAGVILGVSAG